ncbi:PAS domain-containing protein [Dyadobacter arcticus]|uniref:histidine kinase n=1 Tax=Dyadobacter arcticus TaxID=1078754 RepID=A0ABX0UML5_9BACT|nr:PAS domain-containing protein [Dyadobacter arcticus]NIJ54172.1 PAS domain S-box-containing protein [Dyadobacter arcticus]
MAFSQELHNTLWCTLVNDMSQNYINQVFKALPAPSVILLADSPKFTIKDANDAYFSFTGETGESLIGKGFFEAFPDLPTPRTDVWGSLLEKVLQEGHSNQTPVFRFLPNSLKGKTSKEHFYIATNTPIFDGDGEIEFIVRSIADVTHIAADGENGSNFGAEKFLDETQRVAKVGGWDADLLTGVVTWSEVVKEIYEVGPDYQPDIEFPESFYKEGLDRDRFVWAVQETIAHGAIIDLELIAITAKGNEKWIRITGRAEFNGGVCTRVYGAVQDIHDRKMVEEELIASHNKLESLIQTIDGIVWEVDITTFGFYFVSDQVGNILGYEPQQWLDDPEFWKTQIHPEDREKVPGFCQRLAGEGRNSTFVYRMFHADGDIVWIRDQVTVIRENGKPVLLRGLMLDITETKRLEDMEHLEKTVLELNSSSESSLQTILIKYLTGIEQIFPQMKCSILGLKNNRLRNWAAPSLPETYTSAIENREIGDNEGSCGTAAFRKEKVVVSDIGTDPRWANYKELALKHDLRACWSHPIIILDDVVVATFAVYYKKIKFPEEEEIKIIDRAVAILKVILESRQIAEMASETTLVMAQGQELARFGNWQWDVASNVVTWSDTLFTIYGVSRNEFTPTFEGYLSKVSGSDRERVAAGIQNALENRSDFGFEETIIHSSGEERYLRTWGKTTVNEQGEPVKMIGACLDITDSKKIQKELLASESRLRSLVDSQTNYVIRTDLMGNYTYYNNKFEEDFGWFYGYRNFMGVNCMQIVRHDDRKRVMETVAFCLNNPNTVCPLEIEHISPDDERKSGYWHFIALPDANGKATEIQCIGVDVSDRKRAVDALKKSNERYELLNKATNDAIYDWDLIRDRIQWGDGFYRLFGFDIGTDRYPMENWAKHIHPADKERIEQDLLMQLGDYSQSKWTAKYRFRKADGHYAFIEETGYIRRNRVGNAVRMIGVLRDVTDRLRHISEIEERNQKLQEIAWLQSHVIRAPLARLMGLVDLIRNYENSEEEKVELLDHIMTSANDLDEIIRNISSKAAQV